MRIFLITSFFLIVVPQVQSQECWECLVAARNLDKTALELCLQTEKKLKSGTNEKAVVSLVIGRLLLTEGKPDAALKYLNVSVKSSDSLFQSISLGLLGDYYLDRNELDLALDYYSKASELANNTLFTPYFLNKQGVIFQIQNEMDDFERIGSRLKVNHLSFFNSMNLADRYGRSPSKYDASNRTLLDNRLPSGPYGVGLVHGKQAESDLFNTKFRQFEESYAYNASYNIVPPPTYQLYEITWEAILFDKMIQLKEIAFALSANERDFHAYLFGENGYAVLPEINQAFSSKEGFQKDQLENYVRDQENATDSASKELWEKTKRAIKNQIAMEKYFYLLGVGLNVTMQEAELADKLVKKTVQIKGVHFPSDYFAVSSINRKELESYFEQHKADPYYEYPAVRKMKYFKFPIAVGKSDSLSFWKEMQDLKSEFENTKSDSLFILEHSDLPKAYNSSNHLTTSFPVSSERAREYFTYPDEMDSLMNAAKIGQVVGPYIDKKAFRLAKVIGFNENLLTVRQILVKSFPGEHSEEERERKREFALDLAKKVHHNNFEEYVRRYSEDPGSYENGGVYEDFMDYEMVEPFSNFALKEPIGKIGVVETDFGFHIVEVLGRKPTKVPVLAIVERKLVPDKKAQQLISTEVDKLYSSMKQGMGSLAPNFKKTYFDSVAESYGGSNQININEFHPVISYFSTQETNDRMLEYAYAKNTESNKLIAPIMDSIDWIFPLFCETYSGSDYNLEQVLESVRLNCSNDKKMDSLQEVFGKLSSIEEFAEQAKLKILIEDISIDPRIVNEGITPDFAQHLVTELEMKSGLQWFQSFGRCWVYEISSIKNELPLTDFSILKMAMQEKLMSEMNHFIKYNSSLTLKTIYNYPLFRLGLRP